MSGLGQGEAAMRPPERDVTFVLYQLKVSATEDVGGDEPYMWILGFKVDADTLGPPPPGSIVPSLGVQVFEGAPASPFLLGTGDTDAPATIPIQPNLGTRGFRLKPALLLGGRWFDGIAGIICLLWDQDGFAPSTSEAGYKKFKSAFGPALTTELNNLVNGTYDDPLSRDASGNVVPMPPDAPNLTWRLARLRDAAGRKNAVKAITRAVKDNIVSQIEDAITKAAGYDELIDPDDLLGAEAAVFMGEELAQTRDYTLDFTEEEANYTAFGHAWSSRVHLNKLQTTVTTVDRELIKFVPAKLRVCWFPERTYWIYVFRQQIKTRFELITSSGGPPSEVRWFLDKVPLADGESSIPVTFQPAGPYFGPPKNVAAASFPGGAATFKYKTAGPVLEIWNEGGNGVFFGTVTALYGFAGDPTLSPTFPATPDQLLARGYEQSDELAITAVDFMMDQQWVDDVLQCARTIDEIDRKHILVDVHIGPPNPGDPPPFRDDLLQRATAAARLANAVGMRLSSDAVARKPNVLGARPPSGRVQQR
jgi:hypothetical protein